MDNVEQHLTTLGMNYERLAPERIGLGFTGTHRSWRLTITTYGVWLGFFVYDLQQVPERRLPEVLRLINTVNSTRLSWGAFWVRPTDQQLCFDLCLPAVEPPTCNQVHVAVSAQTVVDQLYPAFMRVIWAQSSAEEALAALNDRPSTDEPPEEEELDLAV
jgi:hypothetical protein